jgi:catechol 2,3-dioxygenase-like lactoylglutathione lyase family enzyme
VHLRGYGFNFELLEYQEPRGERRAREPNHAGSAHLCFVADDLEAEYERLKALGVHFRTRGGPQTVEGGPNDGGKGLYLEDPDGNAVEVIQLARPWPEGSRPEIRS